MGSDSGSQTTPPLELEEELLELELLELELLELELLELELLDEDDELLLELEEDEEEEEEELELDEEEALAPVEEVPEAGGFSVNACLLLELAYWSKLNLDSQPAKIVAETTKSAIRKFGWPINRTSYPSGSPPSTYVPRFLD